MGWKSLWHLSCLHSSLWYLPKVTEKKIIEKKKICEDVRFYWGCYSGCSSREMVSTGNKKKVNIHALVAHFIGSCFRALIWYKVGTGEDMCVRPMSHI